MEYILEIPFEGNVNRINGNETIKSIEMVLV